jgi:hypothetical protein
MNSTELKHALSVAAIALFAATSVVAHQAFQFVDDQSRTTSTGRPEAIGPVPVEADKAPILLVRAS